MKKKVFLNFRSGNTNLPANYGRPITSSDNPDFALIHTVYDSIKDSFEDADSAFGNGATGPTGPAGGGTGQGFTGYTGYTGSQGEKGFTGYTGYTGSQGIQGFTGYTGSQGIQGFTGYTGYTGSQGIQGFTGYTGYTGSQGEKGFTGYTGYTGSQGIQGFTGYTGSQGIQGFTGYTGYTGSQGIQGFTGYTGYTGSQGIQGFTGYTGSQGEQGFTGYTGYTGSQGEQGFTGYTGYTGSQGEQGFTGYTGYTGSQGIQGFTGYTGYTGSQGIQGFTGYTGYTGSQGEQGFTGYTGYTGSQGEQGFTGYTGYTGSQGEQGFTGYTGYTGSQGEQGFTGYTGSQGIQGFTGYTGYTGSQGIQGFTGYTGYTGSQGSQGAPGYATTIIPSNTGYIPTMTSSTTSGFTISSSSEFNASFAAWKACDGNLSTDWAMSGSNFPSTWQVQTPTPVIVWKIEISKRDAAAEYISSFYFEGSNDGTNWTSLLYSNNELPSVGSPPSFLTLNVNDPSYTPYMYYRVRNMSGVGPNPGFAYFQMYVYQQTTYVSTGPTGPVGPQGVFNGTITFTEGTNIPSAATIDNFSLTDNSFFKLTGTTSSNINGFANGVSGRFIIVVNNTNKNQTFVDEETSSLAQNRFTLGVANKTIGINQAITFIYVTNLTIGGTTGQSRWIMTSTT